MRTSRLGNVTGAMLLGCGAPWGAWSATGATRAAGLLDQIFEETLLVGGVPAPDLPGRRVRSAEPPGSVLQPLIAALEAASGERVLLLARELSRGTLDLLLALTTWPEADALVASEQAAGAPIAALCRRAAWLPIARTEHRAGASDLESSLDRIGAERLTLAGLGLVDLVTSDCAPGAGSAT